MITSKRMPHAAGDRHTIYTEVAYIFGIILTALGTALIALSEIGVALPLVSAHVIHGLLHEHHWITLGLVEIGCQAVLFLILSIIFRHIKRAFLISMATSVIYAAFLDLFLMIFGAFDETLAARIIFFVLGFFIFALGETFFHYTYIQPEFYEFFCHSLSEKWGFRFFRVKFAFELTLCLVGIAISFIFHGLGAVHGLGIGTLICAALTINTSHLFAKIIAKHCTFRDGLKWRKFFVE